MSHHFELCRGLRDDPRTALIPRVILSACASSADQAKALAAGADRYVVKTASMKTLMALVDGLIRPPCAAAAPSMVAG
jgi:DNA-binding response OmpR family regulator